MRRFKPHFMLSIVFVCFLYTPAFSATIDIDMRDSFFQPQNITISAGDTVRWTNNGFLLHTATSGTNCNSDGIWDSGNMSRGDIFSFTFTQPGTYPYFCLFHCLTGMVGTITVEFPTLIPVPSTPQAFPFFQAVQSPLLSGDPFQAKPIGLGALATGGGTMNIDIGLNQFTEPVDIYLALLAPSLSPDILLLTPAGLQPLSSGLASWMQSVSEPLSVTLLQNFPISALPQGSYTFFLAVTPAADTTTFYLWMTGFTFSSQLENPIAKTITSGW
ncbi:MAG: plastocyanin/azurin family copper-binding protein [Nitrospirota bacterium]